MLKTITHYFVSLSFIILFLSACKKQDSYLQDSGNYASPVFIDNSTLGAANFGVKYNGEPMNGLVLTGPGKFTFYNKATGEILLEKELDIKADDKEPWYFFQPDATIEPQLIRNLQTSEPDPETGYFKIKIVNLAKVALPYKNMDVILNVPDENYIPIPYDTLKSVGSQLDTASYYLIKKHPENYYTFSFIDHDTQQPILDETGNIYISGLGLSTFSAKDVYTYYITEQEMDPFELYIYRNNKYYDIIPNELFAQ